MIPISFKVCHNDVMKRQVFIGLIILMLTLVLFAACGRHQRPEGTLSVVTTGFALDILNTDSPVYQKLRELTDTTLNIRFIPDRQYMEIFSALLASNSLSDIMFVDDLMNNAFNMAIRGNAFWRLNDFIPKLPNISQVDPELLRRGSLEGNIYGLSRDRVIGRLGMFYRRDWADRLGIPTPQTIEDLFEMARAFTQDDPTGTGRATFGISEGRTMGQGSFANFGAWFGAGAGGGPTRMFTLDSDNRVIPVFATEEFIDSMNFSRRLFEAGFMNRDFITTANRNHNIVNGTAGIVLGPMDDAVSAFTNLRRLEPYAEFGFVGALDAGHGLRAAAENPGFKGFYVFSRTTLRTEDELMEALMFFDSLNTTEVNNLLEFGIEGLHYTVQDGVVIVTPEQNDLFRIHRHDLGQLRTFHLTVNQAIPRELTPLQAAIQKEMAANSTRFVTGVENGLFSPALARMGHTLQVAINDAQAQYIMGQLNEAGWRAAVARWFADGGNTIVEELTASHQRLMAYMAANYGN